LSLGTADVGGKSNYLILTVSTDDTPARLSIPGHAPTILAAPQSQYPPLSDLSRFYFDATLRLPTSNFNGDSNGGIGVKQSADLGPNSSSVQGVWFNPTQSNWFANTDSTIFYNISISDSANGDADPQSGDKLYISRILIRWAPFGETPADP
jgi:hypothetical protein